MVDRPIDGPSVQQTNQQHKDMGAQREVTFQKIRELHYIISKDPPDYLDPSLLTVEENDNKR